MDADADCNSFATERMMIERRDVEFEVEGGDRLRGWLFVPETSTARRKWRLRFRVALGGESGLQQSGDNRTA
jgi:hypothetical protein